MTYSIEQLKGEVTRGSGFAKSNQYRVILPVVPDFYINTTGIDIASSQSLNVLCKSATMPGRQILTHDRTIGAISQKVAYGYATEDVNLTFYGLNNYVARKYFESWQEYVLNQTNYRAKYKETYAKTVTIQQLDSQHRVVYSVNLEKAFPTQILNIDFTNENSNPVEISVTLSFTRWTRNDLRSDALSTVIQGGLENIILN